MNNSDKPSFVGQNTPSQEPFPLLFNHHIEKKLQETLHVPITLVTSPSGYGKTDTISQWLSKTAYSKVWLTLDEDSNDPIVFVQNLISAFQQTVPGVNEVCSHDASAEDIVSELTNVLCRYKADTIVVFDQYELIVNDENNNLIRKLIRQCPSNFHLVLITKVNPGLPLSRWRLQGKMLEIKLNDLAPTIEEIFEYFRHHNSDLDLSTQDISMLYSATEGWPAGLKMLISHLQDTNNSGPGLKPSVFSSIPYVYDFFIEEIYLKQAPNIRDFLLQTSCLDYMNSSLCDAVTESSESQKILEYLESQNSFIVPLDNNHSWYRYHNLFQKVLFSELVKSRPDSIDSLYTRGSNWYYKNGYINLALKLASKTNSDHEYVISLLIESVKNLSNIGDIRTILDVLKDERFKDKIKNDNFLKVASTLNYFYEGDLLKLEFALREWEDIFKKDHENSRITEETYNMGLVYMNVLRTFLVCNLRDPKKALELINNVREQIDENNIVYPIAIVAYSYTLEKNSLFDKAINMYLSAINQCKKTKSTTLAAFAVSRLARIYEKKGQLIKASQTCRSFLDYVTALQYESIPAVALIHSLFAKILCENNQLRNVEYHYNKAIELVKDESLAMIKRQVYLDVASTKLSLADPMGANLYLEMAENAMSLDVSSVNSRQDRNNDLLRIQIWLFQNNNNLCLKWANEILKTTNNFESEVHINTKIAIARIFIAVGKYDDAKLIIMPLIEAVSTIDSSEAVINLYTIASLIYYYSGKIYEAVKYLKLALVLAKDAGYVRIFLNFGSPIHKILEEIHIRDNCEDDSLRQYILNLINDFSTINIINGSPNEEIQLLSIKDTTDNPLTKREIEILQMISNGYSNKEIGELLYISVNTAKKHLKSLYSKLNVNSRTQAIQVGHKLHIIN